ncbi:MAG: adenylyltransferase/cytidyltransferase family protein [Candidatus Calescibacterium sp.]|nr:adenylyltransferase/cytidyltransferase family protein [Candidatus Calescibacterium sp.]MDW8132129.1 adenylyltransferase/cytidyltransferase family protein [Candidatus Calescibacterium sp.]
MRIGLYPGTFNPIHIGHLTVINYSVENLELDLLYVIPNKYPVHKQRKYIIDPLVRLKMIELSIRDMIYKNKIKVSDFEVKNSLDSYTFFTVDYFRNIYPSDELFLIIGIDSLIFYYWQNFDLIFKLVDFFVLINTMHVKGSILDFVKQKLEKLSQEDKEHNKDLLTIINYGMENLDKKFILLDIPVILISSSLIWERLENKKSIDYWVNEKVKKMLYEFRSLGRGGI